MAAQEYVVPRSIPRMGPVVSSCVSVEATYGQRIVVMKGRYFRCFMLSTLRQGFLF